MDDLERAVGAWANDWANEKRHIDAAASRSAAHWQRRRTTDELTLGAVFCSLVGSIAKLTMDCGRTVGGHVIDVGNDFCIVETTRTHLIVLGAIESVECEVPARSIVKAIDTPSTQSFASRLEALADRRVAVVAYGSSGAPVGGDLVAVGQDVIVIERTGEPKVSLVVPIAHISDLSYSSSLPRDSG